MLEVAGSSPTPCTFRADGQDLALRALPRGTAPARRLPTEDASQEHPSPEGSPRIGAGSRKDRLAVAL